MLKVQPKHITLLRRNKETTWMPRHYSNPDSSCFTADFIFLLRSIVKVFTFKQTVQQADKFEAVKGANPRRGKGVVSQLGPMPVG